MKYYAVGPYKKGTLDGTCALDNCHRVVEMHSSGIAFTLCAGHRARYYHGEDLEGRVQTRTWYPQPWSVNSFVYEDGVRRMGMSLIEEKYEELVKYLHGKCYSWRADFSRYDDIVSSTVARLLQEDKEKPFENARQLWGRATNIVKEEIAQTFADRLPVSGVKFQAHWTATKALQAAGGDPRAAYGMQTGTSRVGRELIFAVAHGPSLYSPEYLSDINLPDELPTSSLTQQDEDNVRVAMYELTEQERQVVHLRMWMRLTNAQVGEEMGLSAERVRKIWQGAIKKMRPILEVSLPRFS